MMRTRRSRLLRLEQRHRPQPGGFELWLDDDDGWLLGPNGERITQEEFERRYPDSIDIGGMERQPLRVVVNRLPPRGDDDALS